MSGAWRRGRDRICSCAPSPQAFPDGGARAVVVGSAMFGEESYERELPALAARLGLAGRVEFRGFREDVWAELASFDVLVHASLISGALRHRWCSRAWRPGCAVIAPDEGGPATMIADGETGVLFRSRERDSLAAAMRELGGDAAARDRLGAAARGVLGDYDPGVVAAQWEQLYGRIGHTDGRLPRPPAT